MSAVIDVMGNSLGRTTVFLVSASCLAGALLFAGCGGAAPPPAEEPKVAPAASEVQNDEVTPPPSVAEDATEDDVAEQPPAAAVDEQPEEEEIDPGPAQPYTPSAGHGPLELKLTLSPGEEVTQAEAESFYLNISVKNPTRRLINPDFPNSELLVNGKRLKYWRDTVADLPKAGGWVGLGTGQKVEFIFKVAEKVKVKPGDYAFVLKAGGSVSSSVRLHVRP